MKIVWMVRRLRRCSWHCDQKLRRHQVRHQDGTMVKAHSGDVEGPVTLCVSGHNGRECNLPQVSAWEL